MEAVFSCDGGKTIDAVFHNASTTSREGNSVSLTLSDSRKLTLPQALSADGARYASSDESIVFWNVGNTATFSEHSVSAYNNCATTQ